MTRRRPRGSQLLEALFAFFVIGIVVLALFNLFPSATVAIRKGNDLQQASNLAATLLSQQRAIPVANLASSDPAPQTVDGIVFTPHIKIGTVQGHDPNQLKKIQVTINWEMKGRPQTLTRELWVCAVSQR